MGPGQNRAARLPRASNWALIQRCQLHKLRNVLEHLPERKREWVGAKMRKAWESASTEKAGNSPPSHSKC